MGSRAACRSRRPAGTGTPRRRLRSGGGLRATTPAVCRKARPGPGRGAEREGVCAPTCQRLPGHVDVHDALAPGVGPPREEVRGRGLRGEPGDRRAAATAAESRFPLAGSGPATSCERGGRGLNGHETPATRPPTEEETLARGGNRGRGAVRPADGDPGTGSVGGNCSEPAQDQPHPPRGPQTRPRPRRPVRTGRAWGPHAGCAGPSRARCGCRPRPGAPGGLPVRMGTAGPRGGTGRGRPARAAATRPGAWSRVHGPVWPHDLPAGAPTASHTLGPAGKGPAPPAPLRHAP